jgi:DNA-binding GntR family transcriptional regulator
VVSGGGRQLPPLLSGNILKGHWAKNARKLREWRLDGCPRRARPVERAPNLSGEAYDAIRQLILSGGLAPGEHVAVRSLSERFGLSPTPIRTALAQLAQDGLLEALDRRGYFIPALNHDDMLDIYDLREAVDAVASRRVAEQPDRRALSKHLRDLLQAMEKAVAAGYLDLYGELDVEFHGSIWKATNNQRLALIATNLLGQVRAGNKISAQAPGRLPVALCEHVEIVDALEAGDPERAERATRHHVRQAKMALSGLLG